MVWPFDAFVQPMFWNIFGVWHGRTISQAEVIDWSKFIVWVFRERFDGRGCLPAGFGNPSSLAWYAHFDGRGLGACVRIGSRGGGEVVTERDPLNIDLASYDR